MAYHKTIEELYLASENLSEGNLRNWAIKSLQDFSEAVSYSGDGGVPDMLNIEHLYSAKSEDVLKLLGLVFDLVLHLYELKRKE